LEPQPTSETYTRPRLPGGKRKLTNERRPLDVAHKSDKFGLTGVPERTSFGLPTLPAFSNECSL
jgi:hypothetical protein